MRDSKIVDRLGTSRVLDSLMNVSEVDSLDVVYPDLGVHLNRRALLKPHMIIERIHEELGNRSRASIDSIERVQSKLDELLGTPVHIALRGLMKTEYAQRDRRWKREIGAKVRTVIAELVEMSMPADQRGEPYVVDDHIHRHVSDYDRILPFMEGEPEQRLLGSIRATMREFQGDKPSPVTRQENKPIE